MEKELTIEQNQLIKSVLKGNNIIVSKSRHSGVTTAIAHSIKKLEEVNHDIKVLFLSAYKDSQVYLQTLLKELCVSTDNFKFVVSNNLNFTLERLETHDLCVFDEVYYYYDLNVIDNLNKYYHRHIKQILYSITPRYYGHIDLVERTTNFSNVKVLNFETFIPSKKYIN